MVSFWQPPYPPFEHNTIYWDDLEYLVLHHTAGSVATSPSNGESLCLSIDRSHREDRGWACLGYNFLVGANTAYNGRAFLRRNGANYDSEWNPISISICWLGHADNVNPSSADKSLILDVADWVEEQVKSHGGPPVGTLIRRGHCDEPGVDKSCPGRNLYDWWRGTGYEDGGGDSGGSGGDGGGGDSGGGSTSTFTLAFDGSGSMTLRMMKDTSPNMTGTDVKSWQRLLSERGYSPGSIDGSYGENTASAVRKFQSAKGLTADGIIGAKTGEKLIEG